MKLYNTLTRRKDELRPLSGNVIKLYTCGLTVYAQPHIGNWVGYIYWDVLQRVLEDQGYTVERTQNITDVGHLTSDDDSGEDKMQKGARASGLTAWDVADKYIKIADHEAYSLLSLKRPTSLVRATDYIKQQIEFVKTLETKDLCYAIKGDGVYFDTSRLEDYGKLARLDIDGLKAGARVPVDGKKNITDFALWKFSHPGLQRDMEWLSPWGVGFPGWHLECSVIARETLGDQIDIHCGGIDHIPVHHTNEIAQTESLTGKQFSQFWVHNNHIKVDGTKMAKSLGNVFTLQDILDNGFDIMAFKVLVLSKHYQTEGNFTWDNLKAAQNRLNAWKRASVLRWQYASVPSEQARVVDYTKLGDSIAASLADDLDTPAAVALIDSISQPTWRPRSAKEAEEFKELIEKIDLLLGLNLTDSTLDVSDDIKNLIGKLNAERDRKDWQASDKIRGELLLQNITISSTPTGTVWSYTK